MLNFPPDMLDLVLRPATAADHDFLAAVYASTRAEEMAVTGWPEEFKAAFCAQQFAAQTAHYQTHYSGACFSVVEHQGVPVGRLIVLRSPERLHIVDVSLLPAHRSRGIGARLIEDLLAEADAEGKTVCLCVERRNRARGLYDRLGFQVVADEGMFWRMEWRGSRAPTARGAPVATSLVGELSPLTVNQENFGEWRRTALASPI